MTGRPDVDPAHKPGTGKRADFCPGMHGGKNWPPIAFSPQDADDLHSGQQQPVLVADGRARCNTWPAEASAASRGSADRSRLAPIISAKCRRGTWTPASRSGCIKYPKSPNWGAMLATAGGLVFTGGTADRQIHAFDAANGKLLWEYPTELGHRRAADVVRHRRQAVHRRARRLGRRPERDAGRAQPRVSRRVSAGAGRGRGVGVRARVTRSARCRTLFESEFLIPNS